jgi:hypothetical protein
MPGDVAILGSTPEFQDLVAEFDQLRAVVIDRNAAFHDHVRHHRWRRNRRGQEPDVIIGDWTEVLERSSSRFVAILSDLTSGNIPYAGRERHYAAVTNSLVDGGVFLDRVLTLEAGVRSRTEVYESFASCPVSIESINDLNCKLLFTSDLREGDELHIEELISRAAGEWRTDVGLAFLEALALITPASGRWWYGRPWNELEERHCVGLTLVGNYPEPRGSAYEGHARLLVKQRGGAAVRPVRDLLHVTQRSRAIAVLEEAKVLLEKLPMPDHELGASFLDRIVEQAVSFRDACHVLRTERMEVGSRHWRFMEALFGRIVDQADGRNRTYSFCWRYQRTEPLFSPEAAEWKTLFAQAIDLASTSRIVVRALMVTEDGGSSRMEALKRLSLGVGPAFQLAFIRPEDFEATKDKADLKQYLDFGVFGTAVAFLTTAYEPAVRGEYVWARERVVGLHDLFDRIWDQAVKPSLSPVQAGVRLDWHAAFAALERDDRDTPVSCVAQVVQSGGGSLCLNEVDINEALKACAETCNRAEVALRKCIKRALESLIGVEQGVKLLDDFRQDAARPGDRRPPIRRTEPADGWTIDLLLEHMYLSQVFDFVCSQWKKLQVTGDRQEIRKLFDRINTRPHAHAKPIDLLDLIAYRDAGMRFTRWIRSWEESLQNGRVEA